MPCQVRDRHLNPETQKPGPTGHGAGEVELVKNSWTAATNFSVHLPPPLSPSLSVLSTCPPPLPTPTPPPSFCIVISGRRPSARLWCRCQREAGVRRYLAAVGHVDSTDWRQWPCIPSKAKASKPLHWWHRGWVTATYGTLVTHTQNPRSHTHTDTQTDRQTDCLHLITYVHHDSSVSLCQPFRTPQNRSSSDTLW